MNPLLAPLPDDSDEEKSIRHVERTAVTPPPTPTASKTLPSLPPHEFDMLFELLGLSKSDANDMALISEFLSCQGTRSLDDLAFIQEEDFEANQISLSRTIQRKMLLIAEYLLQGGSLVEISSMKELIKSLRNAKSSESDATKDSDGAIVALNVGGYKYTTTKDTLCRVTGSLLGGMFSGRHENPARRTKDGSYLIDRDGTHFQHILNFLRVGAVVSLPSNADSKEMLAIEADYYGLEELVRAIRVPQVDVNDHLSEEVLAMRNGEQLLRKAFVNGSVGANASHRGLVPIFCPDNGIEPLPLRFEPIDDDQNVLMGNLRKQPRPGTPVTAKSLEEFRSNFNREHPNVLHRLSSVLSEEPVIIAGGSVLRALTSSKGSRTADWWGKKSDIDLFLHCQDRAEANRIARRIFYALAVDQERWVIMRSRGVITMHNWVGEGWRAKVDLKVQIVLRLYESPAEVLLGFDVDCCCCAYDGRSVWVTPRCLRALKTGVNILNPLHAWPNKASYELRLAKYAYRGFAVMVPGLDKKRIDYDRIRQTRFDTKKLKGMARLLKISFEMESMDYAVPPKDRRIDERLSYAVYRDEEATDLVVDGMSGYDDAFDNVIIPTIYGEGEAMGMMWYDYVGGNPDDFPRAVDCRDEAWSEIVHAEHPPRQGVQARLLDSWDMKKRSREYLNADMDKFDLDNIYYGHAYVAGVE